MRAYKTQFVDPYKLNKTGKLATNLPILNSKEKQSGVYLIKSKRTGIVVYVGFSSGKLYHTIFRHFQKWTDIQKVVQTRFTYKKTGYTVRVIMTTASRAAIIEKYLIMKMEPRDNFTKYKEYLTASQQTTCESILKEAEIISIKEDYPF